MKPFIRQYCQMTDTDVSHIRAEWDAMQIMQQQELQAIMGQLKQEYRATGMELPASLLGTILLGPLIAMIIESSEEEQAADLSLPNLSIQLALYDGSNPYLLLKPKEKDPIGSKEFTDRLPEFIRNNLKAPIEQISEAAHVKPTLIWNQFGARFASTLEAYQKSAAAEHGRKAAKFSELIRSYQGNLFGTRKNPFIHEPAYIDNPYEPGTSMMIRSACCMFYKKENGQKCANCPLTRNK